MLYDFNKFLNTCHATNLEIFLICKKNSNVFKNKNQYLKKEKKKYIDLEFKNLKKKKEIFIQEIKMLLTVIYL